MSSLQAKCCAAGRGLAAAGQRGRSSSSSSSSSKTYHAPGPALRQRLARGSSSSRRPERQQQRRRGVVWSAVAAETAAAPPSTAVVPQGGRGPASDPSAPLSPMDKVQFPDIQLSLYDPAQPRTFDLVVVGSGPSGLAVAERVQQAGFQVSSRPCWGSPACCRMARRGRPAHARPGVQAVAAPSRRRLMPARLLARTVRARRHAHRLPGPLPLPRQVLIVDPNPLAPWMNNFGVWIDEFRAMGLEDCLDHTWDRALVHLDASPEGARCGRCAPGPPAVPAVGHPACLLPACVRCAARLMPSSHPTAAAAAIPLPAGRYLSRPYGRVDRPKLKRRLLERCVASGVTFHRGKVGRGGVEGLQASQPTPISGGAACPACVPPPVPSCRASTPSTQPPRSPPPLSLPAPAGPGRDPRRRALHGGAGWRRVGVWQPGGRRHGAQPQAG